MKTNRQVLRIACLLMAAAVLAAGVAIAAPDPARLVRVDANVQPNSVRILAQLSGPFEYTTSKASDHLFVVDFTGVAAEVPTSAKMIESDIVSSYRLVPYSGSDKSAVRLEVIFRTPEEPIVERVGHDQLKVTFSSAPKSVTTESARVPALRQGLAIISKVTVSRNADQTQVRIEGNAPLAYETTRLSGPDRLVLDFPGAALKGNTGTVPSTWAPVRSVRMAQFQADVARVVIDLNPNARGNVAVDGNALVVSFGGTAIPARSQNGTKSQEENTTTATQNAALMAGRELESLSLQRLSLPESLIQQTAALAHPKAGDQPAGAAKPEAKASAPSPQSARPPQAPAAQGGAKYSGEPVWVDLKDVDLKDFFRLIHEISGLNVVVDPAVKGTLTIALDEVPWDQALDIALMNNSLDKQLSGNVLRIATRETLKKEAEIQRDLAKALAEAIPQVTATRVLSYAKAASLQVTLKKFLSPRGEILADERSNMLIIRDIPDVLPDMDNLIRQLDRKSQQVEIEARVVAATRSFSRDIGTQFGFAASATGGRNLFGGSTGRPGFADGLARNKDGTGLIPPPPIVITDTGELPLNTNLGASAPTSAVSYFFSSPNFALDLVITAAESKGVGKLLSKPKVITQNNEKAIVKQGTKIPIQTTINNTISIQFIDAVLQLQVTPQITAEGTIFMQVLVENTQIDPGIPRVLGIPALNTQATETNVLIADGGTVVISGIMISSQRTDVSQVPLIGSIPLIGNLFKRTNVSTSSQELMFFLTPRILPN